MKRILNFDSNEDLIIRALIFMIGFSPIVSVSLSTFGLIPLHYSGPLIVLPAILLLIGICIYKPSYKMHIGEGLLAGLIAVTLYDTTRMPFLATGIWSDFIPKIGTYLLNQTDQGYSITHWVLGYVWRYLGNGGGMGLAFYVIYPLLKIKKDSRIVGVIYGIGIFACLLMTVYFSPDGKKYLFDPSLLTGFLGFMGHVVYGGTLGCIIFYMSPCLNSQRHSHISDRHFQVPNSVIISGVVFLCAMTNIFAFNAFFTKITELVSLPAPDMNAVLLFRRTFLTVMTIINFFFVAITAIVSLIISNKIAGPLYNLRRTIDSITNGNLGLRLALRKGDYLQKELPEEFNKMLDHIQLKNTPHEIKIKSFE